MKREYLFTIGLLFLGAILLMSAAFINGFPIVYSDSSTYIDSGFALETPFDRPLTYGLFLRLSSLNGLSLWTVIFTQSLLVSYLLFLLVRSFFKDQPFKNPIFLALISTLGWLTSASWTSSQLIPDIFTPIMLLSLAVLIFLELSTRQKFFLYFIFLLATCTHLSHVTSNVLLLSLIFLIRMFDIFHLKKHIRLQAIWIGLILTFASISTMGSALAKSKHGFFMGAMIEHNIAQEYLNEYCPEKEYALCQYKDSLPEKAWVFLWEKDSPFYKMGDWKGTKEEFNEIIWATLTEPKYIGLHIAASVQATGDQLTKFGIGDGNGVFMEGTSLHERMNTYFPKGISSFENSRQNQEKLSFIQGYNRLIYIVVVISLILLAFTIRRVYLLDKRLFALVLFILLSVLIQAWSCGTFANAIDRLGARVMWLIPLTAFFSMISIFSKSTQRKI